MIGLVVTMEVLDGKQEVFEASAKDLMAKVKANEPGCLVYQLFKTQGSETQYVFMEQYTSSAALDEHRKTEYFKSSLPTFLECLAGASQVEMLDMIE